MLVSWQIRPVVIGAPYVLCGFAVGVILMAVGTFITSHAYDDEETDPVLLGVGPGLIGLGGKAWNGRCNKRPVAFTNQRGFFMECTAIFCRVLFVVIIFGLLTVYLAKG